MSRRRQGASLEDLVFVLARDALAVQARLDAQSCLEQEAHARLLARFPSPDLEPTLLALAPPALRVGAHRVTCRARLSVDRSFAGGIRVMPLNLAYQTIIGSSEAREVALAVEVEPVLPFTTPSRTDPRI